MSDEAQFFKKKYLFLIVIMEQQLPYRVQTRAKSQPGGNSGGVSV
jgi:hypothetical protein